MSNYLFNILILSASMFFISMKAGHAQGKLESQLDSTDLEVIGSREFEHGLIDAPVKLEVLSEEYFEEQQYQDLSQGISDIVGVSTTNTQRRAGSKSALIQGFGENSVLIMVDGTPVSQNSSFGFDLTQISASDIAKVEVIKGASSALYGSQAMGGVINIVTKKPSKRSKASVNFSQAQTFEGQGGQARNGSLNYSTRGKLGGLKVALSYRDQEALDLDTKTIAQDDVEFQRYHGSIYYDKSLGSLKLFTQYLFMGGVMSSTSSRPYSSSAFGASVNETDTATHNLKVGLEKELALGKLSAILNYEKTVDDLILNDRPETPYPETFKETNFDAKRLDVLFKGRALGAHEVSAGLLVREDEVSQNTTTQAIPSIVVRTKDIDQRTIGSYEAFIQDTILLGNFEVSPGVRHQVDKDFGAFTAPKINISHYFERPSFSLKSWLSVGTGYRAPSVKERFFTLDHTSVANYIVIGNENLAPEKSISFQIGEELRLSKAFSLHANVFLNQVSGLIETVEKQNGQSAQSSRIFTYENIDKVVSRGIETALKLQLGNRVSLDLNYTYSETINRLTDRLLLNRPLHTGLVTLKVSPSTKFSIIGQTRFTGAKFIDDESSKISPEFLTTDLKLNYKLNKKLTIYSRLNNLFDTTRLPTSDSVVPIVDDRPSRGREVFAGLKMEFL